METNNALKSLTSARLIVIVAYIISILVSLAVMLAIHSITSIWVTIFVGMLVATIVIFGFSVRWRNSSMFDAYWSVIPPYLILYLILHPASMGAVFRQWIVFVLVLIWAIRLTYNWARRWRGFDDEDWRYIRLRNENPHREWLVQFLAVHLVPTIFIYLGMIPVISSTYFVSGMFNLWDVIGIIVTLSAIALETIADEQLVAFISTRSSPREVLNIGVWQYVRHPNYTGEIGFWFGLFFFALGAHGIDGLWTLVGAISMLGLFWFASIPLINQRYLDRRDNYADHIKNVPALFPRFW